VKNAFKLAGTFGGYLGVVVCLIAVVGRFYREPLVFGFAASNMLLMGATLLVFACWCKLESA
jgi:hypothetical protein